MWKNIFANNIYNKGLIFNTYKELMQHQKTNK